MSGLFPGFERERIQVGGGKHQPGARRPQAGINAVAFPSRFINNTFEGRSRSDYRNIWKDI
jgi:hypothetical protein